jgi:hypothetical protein
VGQGLLFLDACGGDSAPAKTGTTTPPPASTPATTPAAAGSSAKPAGAAGSTSTSGSQTGAVTTKPPTAGTTVPTSTATAGSGSGTAGATATTAGSLATAGATAAAGGTSGSKGTSDVGGATATGDVPTTGTESSCLDGIEGYDKDGPFKFMAKTSGQVKEFVPMVPAGCKVPIVHLANGTGASCSSYQMVLERFATHGFLTVCYEDPNTGAGTQGVMAFETAMKDFPDLYAKKLGSTGHSQGGQAAFTVLALTEEKFGLTDYTMAGLAMEPASGFGTQPAGGSWQSLYAKIKSPMFMFSGTADMLVSQAWVQQAFDALDDSIEAYHWSAIGATHIPTPQEPTMYIGPAWWRWKLLGDKKACAWFKALPGMGMWNSIKEQNAKTCD